MPVNNRLGPTYGIYLERMVPADLVRVCKTYTVEAKHSHKLWRNVVLKVTNVIRKNIVSPV